MMSRCAEVIIVRTGTANLASIDAGLVRAGASTRISSDPGEIENAGRVVLPGVGAFSAAMGELVKKGLVEVLRERFAASRPTLAICLGMQLLGSGSEESPETGGLDLIPATATHFPETVKVPQLGWNLVEPEEDCHHLKRGYAYFANSYRIESVPTGWRGAITDYGGPFVSAIERDAVVACQFHPELSGSWGLNLIKRWLQAQPKGGDRC